MSGLSEQQIDELAEAMGAMPEAYNVTDHTDEAVTFVKANVDLIATTLAPVVARMIRERSQQTAVHAYELGLKDGRIEGGGSDA